jgi:hypothetical protein
MKITENELKIHRKLMVEFIYSIVMPQLLEIKGTEKPKIVLERFRRNQYLILEKYGLNPYKHSIDFEGVIQPFASPM